MPLNYLTKLGVATAVAFASAGWTHETVLQARPGAARAVLAAPVLVAYWALPFLFDRRSELLSLSSVAAMFLWLASFKVLALVLNRGPLAEPGLSFSQFTALQIVPIIPRPGGGVLGRLVGSAERPKAAMQRLVWRAPENAAVFVVSLYLLTAAWPPRFLCIYAAAFGVCAYCGLWANAAAALVLRLTGIDAAPSWDRPWLQTSLGDFWSRRWNMPAASSLKELIYDPVIEGRLVRKDKVDDAPSKTSVAAEVDVNLANGNGHVANGHGAVANGGHATIAATGGAPDARKGGRRKGGASAGKRAFGMLATFFVSGLMHEILLVVCTGSMAHSWRQMAYFLIQVPLTLAEGVIKKAAAAKGFALPMWASIPIASLTLQIPGYYLFWGPYFDSIAPLAPKPFVP